MLQSTGTNAIRLGIIGVGNCASALVQGLFYCKEKEEAAAGVLHPVIGGYRPEDIHVVAAFDVDRRKVGKDISDAIWAKPNCTQKFFEDVPPQGVKVQMGRVLDGVSDHMAEYGEDFTFEVSAEKEATKEEVVKALKDAGTQVVVNFLPVGSEEAVRFYADCAIEAGCGFVNGMPVFIASDPEWAKRFEDAGLPIVGDDFKAQMGATITHRILTNLFKMRGVNLDRTYQMNIGGNTDFLNMLNHTRLKSKRTSKTEAVQSVTKDRLEDRNIRIGPSDYVPWLDDNKVAFMRLEGQLFGGVPMNMEIRLSVEDSPNAAGIAVDAIRCCKVALDRGEAGILWGPAAFMCKHPPKQMSDDEAYAMLEDYVNATPQNVQVARPAE